ncbi:MAG TPA: glycosyltransferase family 4 protein [Bryobacteraceae bacterium]|nr:glycosyltransferase family 4 protein [Bryobacteraceae bacterium]
MRICVVGGIFGHRGADPEKLKITPETTLAGGLREQGHDVLTIGHYQDVPDGCEIVHVHHLSYGALRAACSRSRARFVFTSHDGPALCGYSKSTLRHLASKFVMARADAVIALSSAEAAFQRSAYLIDGAAHRIIQNGIPQQYSFDPTVRRGAGLPWRLLYVGQLNRLKRVDTLLRALAELAEPVHLSLAFHNSVMEADLRRLATELGVEAKVSFLGACGPDRLCQLYRDSDMLILPSEAESLPSVVSEALMCGLPVVASHVGGIPDQVRDFGELVTPGDHHSLAAAITRVCRNYPSYAVRSAHVASWATERFSIDGMVTAHVRLYDDLLQERGPRRHRSACVAGNLACYAALRLSPVAIQNTNMPRRSQ